MTEVKASLKYLRIAPRKARLVADLIRGLSAGDAEDQLRFMAKRAAGPISKLLKSAVANAVRNFNLDKNDLYILKITVDGGPVLKRSLPRAMGRATPIRKGTSHITLILEERKGIKKETVKAKPKTAPVGEEKPAEKPAAEPVQKEISSPGKAGRPMRPAKEQAGFAKRTLGFGRKIFRRKAI